MKAIEVDQTALRLCERPEPRPGAGEVRIRVAAAGVNRPDVLQRLGFYPPPPGASDVPGLEVAGVVDAAGEGAARWKKGDAVCALVAGGGYAELCVAPAGSCLPIPRGLTPVEAAALPETVFTVWHNVFERARLAPGESLLVHGGTSGIGVTAIQIAKALGHRVFATAGSDAKCDACAKLGADLAVNYKRDDFVDAVLAVTAKKGVDVVLDMVGGDYLARDMRCLAEDGRIAVIAMMGGSKAEIPLGPLIQRRVTIGGSSLRPRGAVFKAALAAAVEKNVWPLVEAGRVRLPIDSTFPLARAGEAHERMESSAHVGKIVLTV